MFTLVFYFILLLNIRKILTDYITYPLVKIKNNPKNDEITSYIFSELFDTNYLIEMDLPNNQKVKCNVIIIKNGKIEKNGKGKIRLRGNGTRTKPKRSYQINFDTKTSILDMPSIFKKWVLLANYMDKTLLRNLASFKVSSILIRIYS